jgi:hypothetical protein
MYEFLVRVWEGIVNLVDEWIVYLIFLLVAANLIITVNK